MFVISTAHWLIASPSQTEQETQQPSDQKAAEAPPKAQVLYDAPQDAAKALVEAIRFRDFDALRAVLGPDVDRLLSGDLNVDEADLQRFTAAYDLKNTLVDFGNGTYTLAIGNQHWNSPCRLLAWRANGGSTPSKALKKC